jgi:hypothetical protein
MLGVLKNDLRDEPGIDKPVIRIDENALAPIVLAPLSNLDNLTDIVLTA